ncbi:MAG: hypothetical protein CL489_03575 [Acidobacteria bacterium]|nr:hypothetical protein [Acidobacteriota bacterium]MBF83538.1 hypothetical protein [Acidobacteriota bacterium]MBU97350.1 hypothetical protein [Dehalococcoidia bacterium]
MDSEEVLAETVVAVLSGFLIILGGVVIVVPSVLTRLAFLHQGRSFYAVAAIRFVIGLVLLLAAAETRLPMFVQLFGALVITSGIAMVLIGRDRIRYLAQWLVNRPPAVHRLGGLVLIAIGGTLFYAVT